VGALKVMLDLGRDYILSDFFALHKA